MITDNRTPFIDALLLPEIGPRVNRFLSRTRQVDQLVSLFQDYLAQPAPQQRGLVEVALGYLQQEHRYHFPSSLPSRGDAPQGDDIQTTKPAAYKALNGF